MLKLHNILENFCLIILGFAIYETVYFNNTDKNDLSIGYLAIVVPLIIFTVYSIYTSARLVRILSKDYISDIEKKNSYLLWTLFITVAVEITVVVNAYNIVNKRTGFLFATGFLIAKLSMYSEVAGNFLKKIVSVRADSKKPRGRGR